MAWGRRARYCCTNVGGRCPYALGDALFDQSRFDAWQGRCKGDAARPGCGAALVPGLSEDRRARWVVGGLAASVALVVLAVLLRLFVFPPPLAHIEFAAAETKVDDTAGEAKVLLRRTQGSDSSATLQARYVDGTARAGEDYLASILSLDLAPGQAQSVIRVPVLRDASLRKGERRFVIVLDNVLGRPRHTVVIAPPAIESGPRVVLEQSVLSASRIAADIANLVVKVETMERLLPEFRNDTSRFEEIRLQHRAAADNLVRAREAYLRALQELKGQPAQQVLSTIDRLAPDLRQRNFRQQAETLPVLGKHFEELVNGRSVDMDRWVSELGRTAPRLPGYNAAAPTT